MYLSRLTLDTTNRNTMKALMSPSIFHGAIESSFNGERKRNLWRIDSLNGKKYLLVMSEDMPDFSDVAHQFGERGSLAWEYKNYDYFLESITNGSVWNFRLTANPTHSGKPESGKRGKVYAHITERYQKEWLMQRSEKYGFLLNENCFSVVDSRWLRFYKKSGNAKLSILSVTFEGELNVKDADLFRKAMLEGIGRGKAYGMGLLTIVRPRRSN